MFDREVALRSKRAAFGILLLFSAIALGFFALFVLPPEHDRSLWRGFRTILVDATVPESDVISRLSAVGVKELLSESTEPVIVSNWSGLETIPLSAVKTQFIPGDPRLDKYLTRIGLWFEAHAGRVAYRAYYLKESSPFVSATSSERALERGLAEFKGRYFMLDNSVSKAPMRADTLYIASAFAFLIVVSAVGPLIGRTVSSSYGLFSRKLNGRKLGRIVLRLLIVLPWAVLAVGGLSAAALAALWGLAFAEATDKLDLPLDEFRRNGGIKAALVSLRLQGMPSMALPAVAILASLAAPSLLSSIGLASLGSLMSVSSYILLAEGPSVRRSFIPMPIGGQSFSGRRAGSTADMARAVLACTVIIAWGICRFISASLGPLPLSDFTLPKPESISGSLRPLLSESRQRVSSEGEEALPGLAAYLEHRAIQEALPFIRIGEDRSDPFASARLPMPHGNAIAKVAAAENVQGVDFSDDWARAAYASVSPLSVEGMLLSQGSAMAVRIGTGGGRRNRPLAPIEYLLYIFLLVPPLGILISGAPFAKDAASSERRQEA